MTRGPLNRALEGFTSTIFAEMSALAVRTASVNLGQGFPDFGGPDSMLERARQAIADGHEVVVWCSGGAYGGEEQGRLWLPALWPVGQPMSYPRTDPAAVRKVQ